MFAPTLDHGLFKSTDDGKKWTHVLVDDQDGMVEDVEISSHNADVVFASRDHLYRSVDGGSHWDVVDPPNQAISSADVEVAESDPDLVYALANQGFFRSSDAGATWARIETPTAPSIPGALLVHPHDPATLYAGGGTRIWKSVDSGDNWKVVEHSDALRLSGAGAAIDPGRPERVAFGDAGGIRLTTDGGSSWEFLRIADKTVNVVQSVAIASARHTIYAGLNGRGVVSSADLGHSWTARNHGLTGTSISSIVATHPRVAYAAVPNIGIAKTPDGGKSWHVVGLRHRPILSSLAAPPRTDTLYASSLRVLLESSNGGRSWKRSRVFGDVIQTVAVAPSSPQTIYVSTDDSTSLTRGKVFRSRDGGRTWRLMSRRVRDVKSMTVDPRRAELLYAGTWEYGVARSQNGGRTWTYAEGMPTGGGQAISSIAVDASRKVIYATVDAGRIYRSTNGGRRFEQATRGMPPTSLGGLAANPARPGVVYVGVDDVDGPVAGVFHSRTAGRRWRLSSTGVRTKILTTLAVDPSGARLYAGSGNTYDDGGIGIYVARLPQP